MEAQFTNAQLSELRLHFRVFDQDNDGHITKPELKKVLDRLGEAGPNVEQLIASVDTDKSGTIEWQEFLAMIKDLRSGKSATSFGQMYQKSAAKITTIAGSGAAFHSFSHEEKEGFVGSINDDLGGDKELKAILPLNEEDDSLFSAVKDGILLCKLINAAIPGTIDERVLNKPTKKVLNSWEQQENHTLALQSAKGIGCSVVNIGPVDLQEGKPHLVLGLVWQIIKIGLLSKINLVHHPELVRLLLPGEELSDLLKLGPEQILLRWVNYHLAAANHPRRIHNFSGDIKDSEAYTVLLSRICPNKECNLSPLRESDLHRRAEAMLEGAAKMKCRKFVRARDVVSGNPRLNLAFVANLFNKFPCLEAVQETFEETREERAFRLWINNLGIECNNLVEDCKDGLVLLRVIDKISGIVDWKKVNMAPNNKFKKVENCNYAIVLGKEMKFSLVNIGGQDIHDGNKKLLLGFVWQLMRADILKLLSGLSKGGRDITDQDILDWANDTVRKAGKSTKASSFQDPGLKDACFLLDLCSALNPRLVNEEYVIRGASTPKDLEMNAQYAIGVARKMGCLIFAVWEDIVEVRPKMMLTFVAACMAAQRT